MESSIFGAEKMEPNDFENSERALVALRDDDAAAFCTFTNRDEMPKNTGGTGCLKNIALPKSEIIKRFMALLTSFFPKRCNKKCCSRERATAN